MPGVGATQENGSGFDQALWWTLLVFTVAVFFSLGGVLLIQLAPGVMSFFGPHYAALVKVPTWTYMAALPLVAFLMYGRRLGLAKTFGMAAWGAVVGGAFELVGTTTGVPFGAYTYTDWLGPKFLGHVPYFIPLSWFAMSMVCYDLACRASRRSIVRVFLAALFMLIWDVSLDPAMNRAFPFWTYEADGIFFGMPLTNWAGWLVVSLVIAAGYEWAVRGRDYGHRFAPAFYFLNCFFPFMLSLLYGVYWAALIGLVSAVAVVLPVTRFGQLALRSEQESRGIREPVAHK